MNRELLAHVSSLADEAMRPCATQADQGGIFGPVAANLRCLGEAGFLGLNIAPQYGGLGAEEATRHEYAEILASACGVTAFTQQQLQTAAKFLGELGHDALKRSLLPEIAAGRLRCGVGLSQLRRSGLPLLRATEYAGGGYRLNGSIPWITGWSLLDGFLAGAALENEEHVFVYVDIARHQASLNVSDPLSLIVMAASDTVTVQVKDLVIAPEHVLRRQPAAELARSDSKAITEHAALPLGCARASARILDELAQQTGREAINQAAMGLKFEMMQCRREVLTWNCDCVDHSQYQTYALRARAGAIVLAMRAACAAVVAAGGRAHLTTAAPQRLLREAQFYATAVQTGEVQAETLDQLVSPFFAQ